MKFCTVHKAGALEICNARLLPVFLCEIFACIKVDNVHSDKGMDHIRIEDKRATLIDLKFQALPSLTIKLILFLKFE